ncbi:MAG: hypothetical protein NTX49_01695 [Chlamydiae bacterium]|nr:hypothetical protein [Chlamydiota bacterium]
MARKVTNSGSKERQAYEQLLEACLSLGPEQNLSKFDLLKSDVSHLSKSLHEQVDSFKQKISKIPLSTFVILWADSFIEHQSSEVQYLKKMYELIDAKLLPLGPLAAFARLDPSSIIEKIRCFSDWAIGKREEFVPVYTSFALWLSKETFGFIPEAVDPDRLASLKRQVPFETYIKIVSSLDLREQILAKMFYLGGSRGLEEVLSVKIEDIDFKKACIHLSEDIPYPRHLFLDIESYIQGRKKGLVFLGKEGERIAHTTPFRALKKVVSDLKLDPEFTFRELTKNT